MLMRERGKFCAGYIYRKDLCFCVVGYHCDAL